MLEWISQLLTILPRKTRGYSFCQSTKNALVKEITVSLNSFVIAVLCRKDSGLCSNRIGFPDLKRINGRSQSDRGQLLPLDYEQVFETTTSHRDGF